MPSWFPSARPLWLLPPRDRRLAQHRALVRDVPPISCGTTELRQQRRVLEQEMATWDTARWEAHDAPWAVLLDQWLDGPPDPAGLRDMLEHHQRAWWCARFANRPDQTAVTRGVWARLRQGQALPPEVLRMAAMSSKTFQAELWTWALTSGGPDTIRATASAFSSELDRSAILEALPLAAPGALDVLWANTWGRDRELTLASWIEDPAGRAQPWLQASAARLAHRSFSNSGAPLPDAHHAAFLAVLPDRMARALPFPSDRWACHWPGSDRTVLRRGLDDLFQLWELDGDAPAWLSRLDAMTSRLAPMVPLRWWSDPDFWPADRLVHMPLTQDALQSLARHDAASQVAMPGPSRRPRPRS